MKPIFQAHTCLTATDIEKYLDETLSPEERFRVENHLLDCPFCEEAVEGQRLFREDELTAAAEAPADTAKVMAISQTRWILRIAAMLLLVIAALFVIRQYVNTDPNAKLFEAYYEAYPEEVLMQMRSTAEPTEPTEKALLVEGLQAYKTQGFEAAASKLQTYLSEQPDDLIASFYLGMTLMELEQFDQAEQAFLPVIQANATYYEEASWYNALSLLQQNEKSKALAQLQLIIQEGKSRFIKQAEELSDQLN